MILLSLYQIWIMSFFKWIPAFAGKTAFVLGEFETLP